MSRLGYTSVVGTIGASGLTSAATSHTFTAPLVPYTNGIQVPSLSGSRSFLLTILDSSGNLSEIVKVTAYDGSTGAATLVRGQNGTSGVSHASGDSLGGMAYVDELGGSPVSLVAPDSWHNVSAFSNSWVNFGGSEPVAAYIMDGAGNVQIRGTIKSGTVGQVAFTLPPGYRPSATMHFAQLTSNAGTIVAGEVAVLADGSVGVYSPSGNSYVRLDGIAFTAA